MTGPTFRYVPAIVATCPECCGDLQPEGVDGFWCPQCQCPWSFNQVAFFDDGDLDD